jgi:gluconokinase
MVSLIDPVQIASPLVLTLDIGTSSSRAMLFDRHAQPVPGLLVQTPNPLRTTPDGGSEFDPAELLGNVVEVIDQLLQQAGPLASQIRGVAVATFVTNFMGLDAAGQPITPVFTYADIRCAPDAEALRAEFDLATVHDRTGCRIHSAYLPARFCWLARTQPDLLKQVKCWLSLGEYLLWEFFGERRVSYSVASWTGLLNRRELAWDQEWLAHLPVEEAQLSPLVDVDQPLQGLRAEWARRWPALKDATWFPAIGDGAAANLGSGCTGPERLALTIGSTGAMRVAIRHSIQTVPAGLWLYRLNRTYALLGGATTEGGNVFAWLNETLQLPADIERELAQMSPAAHGITVLPFVAGERAPGWHDEARASLVGLSLNTRPLDILRAGLEGVAYRFALIYRSITSELPKEHQIIGSGSALLNSPAWMQIIADVLGRPLTASAEREATSRGAALLALEAIIPGVIAANPAATGKTYTPNPDHHLHYQAAIEKQLELYDKLILNTAHS